MAASIYATPPPDLSSEDTALSDVSNTSSTVANNNATAAVAEAAATTAALKVTSSHAASVTSSSSSSSSSSTSSSSSGSSATSSSTTVQSLNHHKSMTNNTCESKSSSSPKLSTSKSKRTIADILKDKASTQQQQHIQHHHHQQQQHSSSSLSQGGSALHSATNDDDDEHNPGDSNAAMAAVAAAANAAMQLQLLEALNDAAKKRRKQNNPTRMEDDAAHQHAEVDEDVDHQPVHAIKRELVSPIRGNPDVDYEDKLSKMFLPKSMEHLKETFEMLQQQQQQKQIENISKSHKHSGGSKSQSRSSSHHDMAEEKRRQAHAQQEMEEEAYTHNPYQTFCKECGENFENEFKLSLHMLHEHNEGHGDHGQMGGGMTPLDILASVKVKMERSDCESPPSNQDSTSDRHNRHLMANGKEQQPWMGQHQMPPMGFPFPPEAAAAAALQAGGYLPLLAVPGFPGVDGLNRPPLRIFNPEAFCELCNKEFCNKYFLKTHKANKHGIYDPAGDTAAGASQPANSMSAMNQMFQLQMQQQQQHLQQQQHQMQLELAQQQQQQQQQHQQKLMNDNTRKERDEKPSQGPSPVYCDICSKRFTNIFAMRRHRAKAHEQTANNSQRNSPTTPQSSLEANAAVDLHASKQFQMPDGFRQDFALEQEEVSFTPQPRKLSPQSQQQAREANFSHDKLKRLGVVNPEAFCELCCKEYCNKYFLRTHKWKRHGVFMPPEDNETLQKLPNWPFMNMPGMPVNLMMAQRMMASSENNNEGEPEVNHQQPSKRIKLETPELEAVETVKESANDENQENRSENNQRSSVPSTPEPHKMQPDAQNALPSAETAMGIQNLQKLQSMIQQLNDLNGKRPLPCHLCGREMENQYALQAHLMTEHSGGMESMAPLNFPSPLMLQQQALLKQSPNGSPGSLMPVMGGMGELRCTPCDREFSNLPEFQKHITEVHLLTTTKSSPLREGFVTPERKASANMSAQGTRPPYTITPTSSYCEICNKELCNKYFMKTHMQRMHGIEIENGAQIGGVVCNICNKELCSKYFLRVHKHNTHGIIEEGAPLPQPRQNGANAEAAIPPPPPAPEAESTLNRNLNVSPFGSAGSEIKIESSPLSAYTENCPICTRRFRSPKWLRTHLLNDHGQSGLEKIREMEQGQLGSLTTSKPSSPTLKIPNGSSSSGSTSNAVTPNHVPSPAQLAQALQNLNAQQLLQNQMPTGYGNEANVASPHLKEYQCSLCSFTTPYYAFLFIHERTHSIMNNGERQDPEEKDDKGTPEPVAEAEQQMSYELKHETHQQQQEEEEEEEEEQRRIAENLQNTGEETIEDIDTNQPTNLSMRTPSPLVNVKEEMLQQMSSRSPSVSREQTLSDMKHETLKQNRSIACSPICNPQQQHMLQDLAEQFGKSASYAVPRDTVASGGQMQAFVIEADQEESNRFVPAVVYLPVRERITSSMKLTFNLTPV